MIRKKSSFFLTLWSVIAIAPAALAGAFVTPTNYPSGENPVAAVVQDFNHDQISDIATANQNDGTVSVFLGNGKGSFGAANNIPISRMAVEVASGDLNGDGNPDLVVADGAAALFYLAGNGDGTFGPATRIPAGKTPRGIAIADFNNDGALDVATAIFGAASSSAGQVAVFLGSGDGHFAAPVLYPLNHNGNRLVAVDLNADGKVDLAVAVQKSSPQNALAVLLGNGDGTFAPAIRSVSGYATDVTAGDFNGDGKPDLALAGEYDKVVRITLGNGDGSFQPATSYPTNGSAETVTAADLNRDGRLDLLVGGAAATVLLGNGDGTFAAAVDYGIGSRFAEAGLFNSDAALDVVAGGGPAAIGVAFGKGDGTFRAPRSYTVNDSIYGFDTADFDGDGKPDVIAGGTAQFRLFVGQGDGILLAEPAFGDLTARFIRAADFDQDGKQDFLATAFSGGGVYFYRGNGDGSFQAAKITVVDGVEIWPAVSDFNHDGLPDVAVTSVVNNRLAILLGKGDGTFQKEIDYSTGDSPQSPTTCDFNGDGNVDVAVSNTGAATVSVYLGNGDGSLRAPLIISSSNPIYSAAGDFNRDGKADLVVGGDALKLFLGNGDGTFEAPQIIYSSYGPVALADLNGDNILDVGVSANFSGLAILQGKGDGTFLPPRVYATGSSAVGYFNFIDLNGDARPEAVVSDLFDSFSVLLNSTKRNRP